MEFTIKSLKQLPEAAKWFVQNMGNDTLFSFEGVMGAGKTTFIKAICEELGVRDVVNSPTFAIINEYTSGEGSPIYHFDFYRIKSPQEAIDFGLNDYLYSKNLCFMEWAQEVEALLPDHYVKVLIAENVRGERVVTLKK
ncbi:MAG: tRNA (adenosine(37)-N6)-threonylcarbamoyltransferase complex ATPase subunit type 1 TsaE [Paludibacteraceae bacterium]|jgi:tRNA threonylcarbamoyladenosine biosynthesis protein TsaE|nr:tRNA (adenosine(37)-N6)-threonylcarbamoyltransferase complex ATPase subunit type 1 TsaE [Paludibacteraceae bacterium]MDI9537414.1 tRNA (adenosine(37)-N6)-threonylcarbamoyltransferase complex ATPase subunit type 1 TsaE [Bacteroidota bacterium]OQC34887.1 MAG: tRNA threonylcarbamoyladenosine biosynthesis protein TsaE [Bacteroidetes bacterium ADurb.Bin057]HHT60845.1 tRNA (adenosine(37)-N6)-threonylcarbamoyltransferase complex ATPase subunit type 1 TsaE [Bacteroidales bacterium]MBP9039624.1 tRNA 